MCAQSPLVPKIPALQTVEHLHRTIRPGRVREVAGGLMQPMFTYPIDQTPQRGISILVNGSDCNS